MRSNQWEKRRKQNLEGKRLIEVSILEYTKAILQELEKNPQVLLDILFELEVTEQDFYNYLSGVEQANIVFYDQALVLLKRKNKKLVLDCSMNVTNLKK